MPRERRCCIRYGCSGSRKRCDGTWKIFGDVTGLELNAHKVFEARVKEVTFVDNKMVWGKITRAEAKRR